jgi:hypothetical protein
MFVAFTLLLAGCGAACAPAEDPAKDIVRNDASGQSSTTTSAPRAASAETLDQFWPKFRRAALAGDAAALRAMSAPVVLQRSNLDDSPAVKLPSARVPAAVATVLTLPDGVDGAGRIHRDILKATPVAKPDGQQPAGTYRFGDMVFARGKTGWRLTELYLDD